MAPKLREFTGCWTCRLRKVKCDLTRPKCIRCAKRKLECQGYQIILGWAPPLTVEDNQLVPLEGWGDNLDNFQRRNVDTVHFPNDQRYSLKQLVDVIETLEGCKRRRVGPFGVYKTHCDVLKPANQETDSEEPMIIAPSAAPDITQVTVDDLFSKTENSWVHYDYLDYAKLTIVAIKGPLYRFNEQNMLHILYPKFFPNVDLDEWEVDYVGSVSRLVRGQTEGVTLTPLMLELMGGVRQKRLFFFSRVDLECDSYFDLLVAPLLELLWCRWLMQRNEWPVKVEDTEQDGAKLINNVRHIIVALTVTLTAFHRANLNHTHSKYEYVCDNYLDLLVQMRKLAILMLNVHLDEYDSFSQVKFVSNPQEYDVLLLLAILMQIEADTCFSVYENYEVLFAIGDHIVRNKFTHTKLLNLARFVLLWFHIVHTFYQLTQHVNTFNYEVLDTGNFRDLVTEYDFELDKSDLELKSKTATERMPMRFSVSFDKYELQHAPSISSSMPDATKIRYTPSRSRISADVDFQLVYLMYGLPKDLLDLFLEIIHLTNHKNIFRRQRVFPRNFPRLCAETYDRLINWHHKWNIDFSDEFHRQLNVYALLFHKALVVYYLKLIKEAPLELYQDEISQLMAYLEQLEKYGDSRMITPVFWIPLVCGADALDPQLIARVERLIQSSLYSSQANYWRGKQVLREIWRRRDTESLGFMDLVKEWDVCLQLS